MHAGIVRRESLRRLCGSLNTGVPSALIPDFTKILMQTFLPYPDFVRSASVLDRQRLGKQRVEAKQIYLALTQPGYGWTNHPAVKMWHGHKDALAHYGKTICLEWRKRGYKDTMLPWFEERAWALDPCYYPPWRTPDFCLSHQSNLIRKLPSHYRPLWPDVPDNLPYIWPVEISAPDSSPSSNARKPLASTNSKRSWSPSVTRKSNPPATEQHVRARPMKIKILTLLFFVTSLTADDAAKPERPVTFDWSVANRTSISIAAQEVKRVKIAADSFKTDYGSYDRDTLRVRQLEVEIWNSGKTPASVTTEVLWFVAPEQPPKGRIGQVLPTIAERTTIGTSELKSGQRLKFQPQNAAVSNRVRYEALDESYASGVKFAGWIVMVRSEARILSYKASTPALDRMAKAPSAQGVIPLHDALRLVEADRQ